MKRLAKILGWAALSALVLGVGFLWWAYRTASRYALQQWTPHAVTFAIPFPLDADEVAALSDARVAAGASADDPLAGVDLQTVARGRAVARGAHLVTSRVGCNGCHGNDFGGKVLIDSVFIGYGPRRISRTARAASRLPSPRANGIGRAPWDSDTICAPHRCRPGNP